MALIGRLPEKVSLMDIAQEIEFVAGTRRGAEELDRGGGVTADGVRKRISEWAKSKQ